MDALMTTKEQIMGATKVDESERVINAPLQQILAVLLDPLALPAWNEAFTTVAGPRVAVVDQDYRIAVLGLPGTLAYRSIQPRMVRMAWQVPGFAEIGDWTLTPNASGTSVRHGFAHKGPLTVVLRHAYRGVAGLRLERLARRIGEERTR